ncbi:MAG: patatin-like phospholipase family protein, partial [Bacteroidota bacterium]
LKSIYTSFPIQLLIMQIRSHHLLLFLWISLFLMVGGVMGTKFGLHYLFLDPEYLGQTGFLSYFIIGIAFGCFFLTWNLTSYLLLAHDFPFLATLGRPFTKFCINNFLVPLSFLLFYVGAIASFKNGEENLLGIFIDGLGLLTGMLFLGFIYFFYFKHTNRDISYYQLHLKNVPNLAKAIRPGRRDVDIDYIKQDKNRKVVKTFLNESLRPRLVRSVAHYDSKLLMDIFRQNHLNALVIQLITILLLMFLGLLTDYPAFRLPAGASILFFLSITTAVIGALTYWLNRWLVTSIIILLFVVNFLTSHNIGYTLNKAYGMDYEQELVDYNLDQLQSLIHRDKVKVDQQVTMAILERWKAKNTILGQEQKPKMVILSTSGGGLTSAAWVLRSVLQADSLLGGQLLDQTVLMTGSSGGVLGSAYIRELQLQQLSNPGTNIYDSIHLENITKDLLNPVTFMLVANDLFVPWTTFEYQGKHYYKDRGYIFEKQINENTNDILDKPLADYRVFEQQAQIPMLYITPAILNDGRKLYISPQGVSFMMTPPIGVTQPGSVAIDGVDFGGLFQDHAADSLRFLTALRMNATFPYILPGVNLPSQPAIEVMDAGFVDNFGLLPASRFLLVFKDWILENTSGVVLLQVRSVPKNKEIGEAERKGIVSSLLNPIEMAGQIFVRQKFEQDAHLGYLYEAFDPTFFHHIQFDYLFEELPGNDQASISFHLTRKEKEHIFRAIQTNHYQQSLQELMQALKDTTSEKVLENPTTK